MSPSSRPIVVAMLIIGAPGAAHGQGGAKAIAQQQIKLAEIQFRAEKYADAAKSFLTAIETLEAEGVQAPAALHRSMARCHERLGEGMPALKGYMRFVELADEGDPKLAKAFKHAKDAVKRLQVLVDKTALTFQGLPKGAEISFNGRVVGHAPVKRLKIAPGQHVVKLTAEGYEEVSIEVEVEPGDRIPIVVKMQKARPSAASTSPEPQTKPGAKAEKPGAPAEPTAPEPEKGASEKSASAEEPVPPPAATTSAPGFPGSLWPWGSVATFVVAAGAGVGAMLLYTDSQDLRAEADGIAAPGSLGDKTQDKAQAEVNKLYTDADGKQTLALLLGITGGIALSVSLWSWAAAPSDAMAVGVGPSEVRLTLRW